MTTITQTATSIRGARLVFLALTLFTTALHAQSNNNPTGPAGVFNGNITTGCSYDPFTGNATRSITDLAVTGAVGNYPLAFTRTANSRYLQPGEFGFGQAGGWRHSYAWEIDGSETFSTASAKPTVYPVFLPDGRIVNFSGSPSDPYFYGPPGVPARFQPLNADKIAYLILADGGKVEFKATRIIVCDNELLPPCEYSYSYQAQAIIDPHGLRTNLFYNQDGSLREVREPGLRTLVFSYADTSWVNVEGGEPDRVIDHVQASDGRVVQFYYGQASYSPGTALYTYLSSVVYPFEPALNISPAAFYTYQAPNGPNPNGYPLLSSCDDPMYAGPMKKISYSYATVNGDPIVPVVVGQILSENNGNTGQIVSRLYVPFVTQRTEVRGDGPAGGMAPVRQFYYTGAFLQRFTDFQGHESTNWHVNGYISAFRDARNHITSYQRYGHNGALTVLTHPDSEQSTQRFAYREIDGVPYFLEILGDERAIESNTYFTRDPVTHRISKIWYPDYPSGPTEEFTYSDNGFGQVQTHTMTSGGVENFRYDGRGLMYESWPPATPSDPNPEQHKTRYFYYTSGPNTDRLWYVVDPRNNATWFEYNTRGQVTKVTHQDGTFRQSGYNVDGTLAWTADENHPNASWNVSERTRYVYDDYKRVISATNPLTETTNLSYAPPNGAGSYSHTTASVYRVTSPLNKITTFDYDENFRRKMVRRGAESPDDDGGTWSGYDEVGNLTSVRDPRGHITTFAYDERDRRISATAPYPFQGQITQWEYDTRSNLKKEIRPDLSFRRMEYDAQSRVIDTYGFANEHTHFQRDLAGNMLEMTDPKPATYFFAYDKLNRKISATYPLDATNETRGETWHYDWAGNMDLHRNPAFEYRHLDYDVRNRPWHSYWNWSETSTVPEWFGPEITNGYDAATRLTSVATKLFGTNNNETLVSFGYDDANRQTWEEQTVAGFPTRRVETPRDDDGFREALNATGGYGLRYDYTKRGQLRTISDGNAAPWFNYSYDLSGNKTRRQDVYGGVNDSTNIMDGAGVSQYDALNRPTLWEQTGTVNGVSNTPFARSHFDYDNLSRLTASWRDEQASKGEWFGYNATGQLTGVKYNADGVSSGNPQNATRTVNYAIASNTLNRESMNDNGDVSAYTPNALNQYENVAGGEIHYDGNFNLIWSGGFSASYNAMNRLTWAQRNEDTAQFVYDGLGRCLKRTVSWETILITYDGWKPITEWDEWGFRKAWNVYGAGSDEILWRYSDRSDDLRYHLDRMGNVAFLLDINGAVVEKYTYDAFGLPTVTDANGENPRPYSWYGNRFMFTGREYFPELGLYDYRNRFYDPILGRFVQNDPIGFAAGDANLFRFCGGDPVNNTDPSGLGHSGTIYRPETGAGGTATTDPVIVTGVSPHDRGSRDVTSLDRSGRQSGEGSSSGDGGSGSTSVTFTRDSNQRGRTRSGPISTQGWWTTPSGFPTGSSWVMTVAVTTYINGPVESGVKSFHSVTVNSFGQIVAQEKYIGATYVIGRAFEGNGYLQAASSGGFPLISVDMRGHVWSAFLPESTAIDYRFRIQASFLTGTASLRGFHDGFPSYGVTVNGNDLYRWRENIIYDLLGPMEIVAAGQGGL